jgi:carbonic anhydrase
MYLYDESRKAKQFIPLQFHYHAPSEHTIDGYLYDLEMHIVHKNESAQELSVIGIFFDMKKGGNETNWFLEEFLENNTNTDDHGSWKVPKLDIKKLVDRLNNRRIYHYEGSLTTPPCSEIVQWIVVDDP